MIPKGRVTFPKTFVILNLLMRTLKPNFCKHLPTLRQAFLASSSDVEPVTVMCPEDRIVAVACGLRILINTAYKEARSRPSLCDHEGWARTTHPLFPFVDNVGSIVCNLSEIQMTPCKKVTHNIGDVNVHFGRFLFLFLFLSVIHDRRW